MRVVIDYDLCEGNGYCEQHVPEVFEVRDDDTLDLLDAEPPETLRARLEQAVLACPKTAIRLEG